MPESNLQSAERKILVGFSLPAQQTPPDLEFIERWCRALESGKFNQCQTTLIKGVPGQDAPSYCCLGVGYLVGGGKVITIRIPGTETYFLDFEGDNTDAGYNFMREKLGNFNISEYYALNDTFNLTFPEIAAVVRRHFDLPPANGGSE